MDPKTSTLTKLFHADTLEDLKAEAKRKQIAFVQNIPEFLKAPEGYCVTTRKTINMVFYRYMLYWNE